MPFQFSCPECQAVLKTANPLPAGKMVKCPKCGVLFAIPGRERGPADMDDEDIPARRSRAAKDDEDSPRPRTKVRRSRLDDEDADYEDEDYQPRRKKKFAKKKKKAALSPFRLALVGGGLALVLLLAIGVLGFVEIPGMAWTGFFRSYANKGTGDEELLAYAPADSNIAGGLDLAELRKLQPNLDALLTGQQAGAVNGPNPMADLKEMVGIESTQIDKMTFAGKFPEQGPNAFIQAASDPPMSLTLRSSVPFDQRQMYRFFNKKGSEASTETRHRYQGKTYYKYPNDGARSGPYVFAPSNNTLVIMAASMSPDEVQRIVASDGKTISLNGSGWDMVSRANAKMFWVVVPIQGSIREKMLQSLKNDASLPPALKPLAPALEKMESVGIWFGSSNDRYVLTAGLKCSDERAAAAVQSTCKQAYEQSVGGLAGQLMLQGLLLKVPQSGKTLVKDLIDHVRFKAEGTMATVTLSAKQSEVRKLIQDMQTFATPMPGAGMRQGMQRFGGAGRRGGGFPRGMPPRPQR